MDHTTIVDGLAFLGCAMLLFLCMAFCAAMFAWAKQASADKAWTTRQHNKIDACRALGVDLERQVHWFSENEVAMLALQAVADHMIKDGVIDADKIRSTWRQMVKKAGR